MQYDTICLLYYLQKVSKEKFIKPYVIIWVLTFVSNKSLLLFEAKWVRYGHLYYFKILYIRRQPINGRNIFRLQTKQIRVICFLELSKSDK